MEGQGSDNIGNEDSGSPGGLAPKDQLILANALRLEQVEPGLAAELRDISFDTEIRVDCTFNSAPVQLAAFFVASDAVGSFPEQLAVQSADLLGRDCRITSGLDAARSQPVSRLRIEDHQLTAARQATLGRALAKRFGENHTVQVIGIFDNIPPEAVSSIVIDPDLASASFIPGAAGSDVELRSGFCLVVVNQGQNETQKFLIRLD